MKLYNKAIELARRYHAGQTDKMGRPYIEHILAVVDGVKRYGENAMVVAALHDIVEDTDISISELEALFPKEIVDAVKVISKHHTIDDNTYYNNVKRNRLARVVKISDLEHNSDMRRIKSPSERDIARTARYVKRLKQLREEKVRTYSSFMQLKEAVSHTQILENSDNIDIILGMETELVERAASTLTVQPWGDASTPRTERQVEEKYKEAYDHAVAAKNDLQRLLRYVSNKDDKILIAIKSPESFVDKVFKRGKDAASIHDVLRSAILAPTEDRVLEIVQSLKKKAIIFEYEHKKFGADKKYGYYGSHHFKIEIQKMIVEVQVMTKKLWTYKSEAHDIYNELRSGSSIMSDAEIKSLLQRSKELFLRGNSFSSSR